MGLGGIARRSNGLKMRLLRRNSGKPTAAEGNEDRMTRHKLMGEDQELLTDPEDTEQNTELLTNEEEFNLMVSWSISQATRCPSNSFLSLPQKQI